LRYASGKFLITLQTEPEKITLFSQEETTLIKWMDFKFQVRFTRTQDGVIKNWLNGKQIVDYKGRTANGENYGYPIPGVFYFKY